MSQAFSLEDIHVVVPAGGTGTRMGGDIPKQYLTILGKPILQHTLQVLLSLKPASLTVAVSAQDVWIDLIPEASRCIKVAAGSERFASVKNALASLSVNNDDWVLVHDAVRPLVTIDDIQRLVESVTADVGGLLAVPVADTLKRVDNNRVVETVDRTGLWRALTPQLFRFGILQQALAEADAAITDEASAVEALGFAPVVVRGSSDNLKITTPADFALAELIMKARQ